ncbi:MAG: hypothetical protein PHD87_07330 [Candidatus Cloacimonetes bacterium]|nr:hypothetical protein [Candidatus Cloacimonadota bacterium]
MKFHKSGAVLFVNDNIRRFPLSVSQASLKINTGSGWFSCSEAWFLKTKNRAAGIAKGSPPAFQALFRVLPIL